MFPKIILNIDSIRILKPVNFYANWFNILNSTLRDLKFKKNYLR